VTHYNTLQHTLQHTLGDIAVKRAQRVEYEVILMDGFMPNKTGWYRVLHCLSVCCSVFRCVAVCFGVLHCLSVCCSVFRCVAVCFGVLQCVSVCVAVCFGVCCTVFQCVISVFQCVLQFVSV